MSNVFTRFRHPTGLEFWDNAVEIGKLLVRFAMNEKNIPKRYTFLFAHPLIAKYQEMRDAIVEANSIYPRVYPAPEQPSKYKNPGCTFQTRDHRRSDEACSCCLTARAGFSA